MLKRISLLAAPFLLLVAASSTASAQEPPRVASLDISVWPEYDQPGVLVQYQGEIANATTPGAEREISVLVPKGAGVGAACGIRVDGNHTSETWKETDAGDGFTSVTYKVTDPQFHVEYYYNPLVGASDKSMDFTYKAASAVEDLTLNIQHPLKATNFVLTPDAPQSHQDKDGFTYHVYKQKQVTAGQTVSSKISYTKTDPSPSVAGQKSQPAAQANQAAATEGVNPNLLVVLAVFFAAVLLVAYFAFIHNPRPAPVPIVRTGGEPRLSRGGFCTGCGSALEPEDRFCSVCGSRRKTTEASVSASEDATPWRNS